MGAGGEVGEGQATLAFLGNGLYVGNARQGIKRECELTFIPCVKRLRNQAPFIRKVDNAIYRISVSKTYYAIHRIGAETHDED